MLRTICYVSTAVPTLDQDQLETLYSQVITNNLGLKITGVLLFSQGNFMQIMEGDTAVIDQIYQKISKDERHHHLFKLIDRTVDQRIFENYSNGFTIVKDEKAIFKLNLYLKWLRANFEDDTADFAEIIKPFLRYV